MPKHCVKVFKIKCSDQAYTGKLSPQNGCSLLFFDNLGKNLESFETARVKTFIGIKSFTNESGANNCD